MTTETAVTIDAAWAEAEAALPEGWVIYSLRIHSEGWRASADSRDPVGRPWHLRYAQASGSTPAAALLALAALAVALAAKAER